MMAAIKGFRGSGGFQNDTFIVSASSRSKFLSVFETETHYLIFSTCYDYLLISENVSLTRTCRELSGLYRHLFPVQWDVDKAPRHYFDNPQCFRAQMAKLDALSDWKIRCQRLQENRLRVSAFGRRR